MQRTQRGWTAAILGLVAVLAAIITPLVYRATWSDAIFPGVSIGSVDVGGMTPAAAERALRSAGYDPDLVVEARAADETWPVPSEAMRLDLDASVDAAFGIGRSGIRPAQIIEMSRLRLQPERLAPVIHFDADATARWLEEQVSFFDRTSANATLVIQGTEVVAEDAIEGRRLRASEALEILEDVAARAVWPPGDIVLPVEPLIPTVRDNRAASARARTMLSAPIELRAFNQEWTLTPEALAPLLITTAVNETFHLQVAEDGFGRLMEGVTEAVSRTAKSPRFHFDDEAEELVVAHPGETGRTVNVARTIERLLAMDDAPERQVQVAIDFVAPEIDENITAKELGIETLLREETSYYRGSSPDRVHNVALAASKFDGVLIAPDAVFSFNDTVGDISEEEGYKKTLIILDGATADGVGGGTCQVSTTLYRSAFWTGLPIVERLAHGYRVAYYEQNSPTGMDATVYGPTIDLKFKNDSGGWLLIETEADSADRALTFRVYGPRLDRVVEMEGPVVHTRVPPPAPAVVVDPELLPGQSREDELEREGLSVTVERIIRHNGEELRDVFRSSYRPTGALTAIGPTPEPQPGEPPAPALP